MASNLQLVLQEWLYFCGARDETGEPVASGFAYFYQPGSTSVAITVYSDVSGTPLSQPVPLDAAGRAEVYAVDEYECIVKDSLGATKRIAVRAGQTSATAVDTVFRSSDAKLQAVLTTIGTELDALNAAQAAADAPVATVNVVTVSTASPSFAFSAAKELNVFYATYAGAVGALTITASFGAMAAYSKYRIVIHTGASTSATSTVFPATFVTSSPPTTLVADRYYIAEFIANNAGQVVQSTSWITVVAGGVW